MREVVIASAVRTPIGKFGKTLKGIPAPRLGALVVKEAIKRAGIKFGDINEVIMGNVVSAGLGQNPARQAAVYGGVPYEIGSVTINKVCGSGLKAVMLAAQAIKAEDSEVVVAGGMENMSAAPYFNEHIRWGLKYGDSKVQDAMINDGLWDAYNDFHMGMTGEIIAEKYGISREEADKFALWSYEKASKAIRDGSFKAEIIPVEVSTETGLKGFFETDECVRMDTTLEKLNRLRPVFKPNGILTAGNSSQLSDGAAALVVMSMEKARSIGVEPIARIVSYGTGGTRPDLVMEAPIPTCRALMKKSGLSMSDLDLIEHNEAYASASLAVMKMLDIPAGKFNVNGGAIALGHPLGCSGARVLTTLLYALKARKLHRGLATLCLGGGNAVAMIVEVFD
jgi:acetyl-CoA C-acetyltransferase